MKNMGYWKDNIWRMDNDISVSRKTMDACLKRCIPVSNCGLLQVFEVKNKRDGSYIKRWFGLPERAVKIVFEIYGNGLWFTLESGRSAK